MTKRKREEEEEEKEELANAPLFVFIKRYTDIVERFVFPLLTSTELRLLSRVNKEMESVVKNGRVWTSKNRLSDRKFSTQLRARDIQTREMLKYACERNELQPCHRLVGFFSGRGQLECVKYLFEEIFRCTWRPVDRRNAYGTIAAAQNGHFKCLRYLVEEGGCYLNERVCSEACGIGSLKMLRYCRNHFAPWNHRCLERAALGGHKDIVMFLLKHDIDRRLIQSANPAIFAAEGGHLDLVQIFFGSASFLTSASRNKLRRWATSIFCDSSSKRICRGTRLAACKRAHDRPNTYETSITTKSRRLKNDTRDVENLFSVSFR